VLVTDICSQKESLLLLICGLIDPVAQDEVRHDGGRWFGHHWRWLVILLLLDITNNHEHSLTFPITLTLSNEGISGLANAKTYLEIHPDADVLILEKASTIGGVWAEHRLYPGLKSNNMLGTYEFSDFPMDPETFKIQPGQHIPGQTMHDYLEAYAKNFKVFDKIRFSCVVESVEVSTIFVVS